MQNTKSQTNKTRFDEYGFSESQPKRGDCLWELSVTKLKPHAKDWPLAHQAIKECNDWMDETCRQAVDRVQEFTRLVREWQKDTMFMSSVTQMAIHPAYQRIIGMGQPAVPLILKEMSTNSSHWFWALEAITGENPANDVSTFDEGVQAWLNWGYARGYLQ